MTMTDNTDTLSDTLPRSTVTRAGRRGSVRTPNTSTQEHTQESSSEEEEEEEERWVVAVLRTDRNWSGCLSPGM